MDPLQELGKSAITAVTNRAVEEIVSLGKTVFLAIWSHLSAKGKTQAEVNIRNFTSQLAAEVQRRVDTGELSEDRLSTILDEPELVSRLLQILTHAAESDNTERHVLFAKLIADRLSVAAESDLAVTSPLASDAIARLNTRHLKLLGLCYTLDTQHYHETTENEPHEKDTRRVREVEWLITTFAPYQDLKASARDAEHLVAVGCVGGLQGFLAKDINSNLKRMVSSDLDLDTFLSTATGQHLDGIWNDAQLAGIKLTSVGYLIGMYTSDLLANRPTDIERWEYRT